MNGIDISNWDNGIDLEEVPADFVICKATQGNSYVSPDFERQIAQAEQAGRCLGIYHYINGSGAAGEMDHFINVMGDYLGRVIPCLDWERQQNSKFGKESYLEECIRYFIDKTGIPPMIYASKACFPWDLCSRYNCGTWVAQYPNYDATGYQDTPWNEGAYDCAIRQYTSSGRLDGFDGSLDLDKFYGDRDAWVKYCNPYGTTTDIDCSTLGLAVRVMAGEFGNGDERKQKLGARYSEVQTFINHIFSAAASTLADEVIDGAYGNGDTRKAVLGDRYDEVQAIVNSRY